MNLKLAETVCALLSWTLPMHLLRCLQTKTETGASNSYLSLCTLNIIILPSKLNQFFQKQITNFIFLDAERKKKKKTSWFILFACQRKKKAGEQTTEEENKKGKQRI